MDEDFIRRLKRSREVSDLDNHEEAEGSPSQQLVLVVYQPPGANPDCPAQSDMDRAPDATEVGQPNDGPDRPGALSLFAPDAGQSGSGRDNDEVPSSQPASQRRRGSSSHARGSVARANWSLQLLHQYEEYRQAPPGEREQLWLRWTREERRYVYCAVGAGSVFRAEQQHWKLQHDIDAGSVTFSQASSSWVHDLTQDGDVHPNPGPFPGSKGHGDKQGRNQSKGARSRQPRPELQHQPGPQLQHQPQFGRPQGRQGPKRTAQQALAARKSGTKSCLKRTRRQCVAMPALRPTLYTCK